MSENYIHTPFGPSELLLMIGREIFRRQSLGKNLRHVGRLPSFFLYHHGSQKIFNDIVLSHASDLLQCFPPYDHVGPAHKNGVRTVLAPADGSEEYRLLLPGSSRHL